MSCEYLFKIRRWNSWSYTSTVKHVMTLRLPCPHRQESHAGHYGSRRRLQQKGDLCCLILIVIFDKVYSHRPVFVFLSLQRELSTIVNFDY